ncbi:transferrin-binding protein B [Neisseria gonorrhoeae]|uniref:Transferrin-binding protein B n=1 Tax=Neisseria gonorrhoeae TaxID=485 RepID=A0A378VVN2_NEIGO|nr:transferrin-binding protein B [Neisseria gonorrhoeae]
MAANGVQTVSNAAGGTSGKTKTYEVQACCSNLNYLKYGLLTRKTADNTMGSGSGSQAAAQTGAQSMFLQGERTDENKIPQEQGIVYLGSWYGRIANGTSWSGNASNKNGGNRAEFTVNFDKKEITGKLTAENRSEATFTIDAMIEGNGFKGTAKTGDGGFALDTNNTVATHKAHIAEAKVQGGFTGLTPKSWAVGLPIRAMDKRKMRKLHPAMEIQQAARPWYSVRNAKSLCNKHGCRTIKNKASDGISALNAV